MTLAAYQAYDATGLAQLVKNKEVKPAELAELAIARAEEVNPQLNAIIEPLYDLARKMAEQVDLNAPLAGVPFLIKDLGLMLKGYETRSGIRANIGVKATEDSFLIDRYRRAGLVFLGRTNTPEMGLTPFTEPVLFGPTRNPKNLSKTAGGSSGGSGAAVAAGIVPLASASDGGGSIRIPASANGLIGLKPSRGRLSLGPGRGEYWSGAIVEGCVSKTVRDTAAFLDVAVGTEPGEPYEVPMPTRPFAAEVNTEPKPLKIGFSTAHTLGHTVDTECVQAVQQMARQLSGLGHIVEEAPLPYQRADLAEVFLMMAAGETEAELRHLRNQLGRKLKPGWDVEEDTYALALLGSSFTAGDFAYQKQAWNGISRRAAAFHTQYDLLLTPTVSMRPFDIGALQASALEQALMKVINRLHLKALLKTQIASLAEKIFGYIPYTPLANMTGQPSISLPSYETADGLPIGTMLTAAMYREDTLLQLAGQWERSR